MQWEGKHHSASPPTTQSGWEGEKRSAGSRSRRYGHDGRWCLNLRNILPARKRHIHSAPALIITKCSLAPPPPRLTGIISKGALVLFGWVCRMTQFTLCTLTLEQLIALVKAAIMTYFLPNIGPHGVRLCCKSIQCNSCNLHRLLWSTCNFESLSEQFL